MATQIYHNIGEKVVGRLARSILFISYKLKIKYNLIHSIFLGSLSRLTFRAVRRM